MPGIYELLPYTVFWMFMNSINAIMIIQKKFIFPWHLMEKLFSQKHPKCFVFSPNCSVLVFYKNDLNFLFGSHGTC